MLVIEQLLTDPAPDSPKLRATIPSLLAMHMDNLVATLASCVEKGLKFELSFNRVVLGLLFNKPLLLERTLHALWHASRIDETKSRVFIESGIIPFLSHIIVGDFQENLKDEAAHFLLRLSTFRDPAQFDHFVSHGGLATVVVLIEKGSPRIKILALDRLNFFFLEIENRDAIKRYLAILQCAGLIPILFEVLRSGDSSLFPSVLAFIESVISLGIFESKLGVPEITFLLTHLQHPDPTLATHLCTILNYSAQCPENKSIFQQKSTIEALLVRLKSALALDDSEFVRGSLFQCFISLLAIDESIRDDLVNSGCIPLIIQDLEGSGYYCARSRDAIKLLQVLGEDRKVMLKLIEYQVVPKLITLLGSPEDEIVGICFKFLFQMVNQGHSLKINKQIVKDILDLMSPERSISIKKAALKFLILYDMTDFQRELKAHGGIPMLLNFLSHDSTSDLIEQALRTLSDFLINDDSEALDNATLMVTLGVIKSISTLTKHSKPSVQNRCGFFLIQILHCLPATPIEATPEVLQALLTQLETPEKSVQERVSGILLRLTRQADSASALIQAGGLPFLFASLTLPDRREQAAIAIVNATATDACELVIESASQMKALVDLLHHEHPKLQRRVVRALTNLAALPEHAAFIREVGGVEALTHFQRSQPEGEDYVNLALRRLTPVEEHSDTECSSPPSIGVEPTELTLKRRQKKVERQNARITQLTADTQALQRELFDPISEDFGIAAHSPRQALVHLMGLYEDLKGRLDAILLLNVDLLIQSFYQGTPDQQEKSAVVLLILSQRAERKSELAEKVGAIYCRQLFNHSIDPLKARVAEVFHALYAPHKTLEEADDLAIGVHPFMVKERPPEMSFIHSICALLGDVFSQVHPMLVGSQARRLQHGHPFDPAIDFDFEIFCFSAQRYTEANSLKNYLLSSILPAGTSSTFSSTDLGSHVLGFSYKDARTSLDFKFSIYGGVMPMMPAGAKPSEQLSRTYVDINPLMPTCIQKSQYNRRLTNRATMVDLKYNFIFFLNPKYRGFTNKSEPYTTVDYGYALYDLAIEQHHLDVNPTTTKLFNEPHLRRKMTDFFRTSSAEQHDIRREALAYTRKHMIKKLSQPPYSIAAPTEHAKSLVQKVLLIFGIDLPEEAYVPYRYIDRSAFFTPVRREATVEETSCAMIGPGQT